MRLFDRPDGPGKSRAKITLAAGAAVMAVYSGAEALGLEVPISRDLLELIMVVVFGLSQWFIRDAKRGLS